MNASEQRRRAGAVLLAAAVLGVLARLLTMWLVPGPAFDLDIFAAWHRVLRAHPLDRFYEVAGSSADHLPGDLYLHGALARAGATVGAEPRSSAWVVAVKGVALLADAACAALAWWLVRRHRPHEPLAAAATATAVFLAPGAVLIGAGWGQWDAVSIALLLGGTALLPGRWWLGAAPPVAWAVLIKPQLALAVLAVGAVWLFHVGGREALRRAGLVAAVGLGTVATLCLPFDVGSTLLGARWSLTDRMAYASDLYTQTTLDAANVWQLHVGDDQARRLWLTLRTIGHLLLLTCLAWWAWRAWRSRRSSDWQATGVWLAAMTMWSFYLCETRAHERYLAPAAVLLLVHAGMSRWRWREAVPALGVLVVLGLSIAVHLHLPVPFLEEDSDDHVLAALNEALFLYAMAVSRPDERAAPEPARETEPDLAVAV